MNRNFLVGLTRAKSKVVLISSKSAQETKLINWISSDRIKKIEIIPNNDID